jgi:hypothetical protein
MIPPRRGIIHLDHDGRTDLAGQSHESILPASVPRVERGPVDQPPRRDNRALPADTSAKYLDRSDLSLTRCALDPTRVRCGSDSVVGTEMATEHKDHSLTERHRQLLENLAIAPHGSDVNV